MAEELKEKIYKFLCKNKGKRFVLKDLAKQTKISYPSVLKWTSVLVLEVRAPVIHMDDYGHIKLIWVEDGKK